MKRTQFIIIGLLLFFWFGSLHGLANVPRVHIDEPWIASTGWKILADGRFASDIFGGLYGMDKAYYTHLPLHPLILAGFYHFLGLSLWVSRFTTVIMGLLVLCLTFALGRRVWGNGVGITAVIYLLFVRTAGATQFLLSGILLWDLARIARYDILVPVFGLLALHLYLSSTYRSDWQFPFGAGMAAALSGLSHIYGNFWFISLLILAIWQRRSWRHIRLLFIGFGFIMFFYLLYIWQGRDIWLVQMSFHEQKLQLWQPGWYLSNLVQEYKRYGPGLNETRWGLWTRPGFWAMALLLPTTVVIWLKMAVYNKKQAVKTILVPLLVIPLLLGLLITPKIANYLTIVIPLIAVAVGWAVVRMWQWTQADRRKRGVSLVLLLMAIVVIGEGSSRIRILTLAAQTTTQSTALIHEIRQNLPDDAHVLGPLDYWLGLNDLTYTNWIAPIVQAEDEPLTTALTVINPTDIIWDERLADYFQSHPDLSQELAAWLAEEGFVTAVTLHDPTYGTIELLSRRP
ncbi:MAG: hypothetical protein H6658_15715 [Ardenticatenaceae bacterium]|nr:hypothetical protein [Ardenticatenaceae bacterium]